MGIEKFRFDGKEALVVGGASGMGLAAATLLGELGATVTVADVKQPLTDVGAYVPLDLRDQAAIDAFVKGLSAPVHVLLSCAGVADAASKWIEAHPENAHYAFMKQAMIAYCAREAPALARRELRINCIAPGPTMTPLMQSGEGWLDFEAQFRAAMDHPGSQPEEQAYPLVFLVSDAASFISGHCLVADLGFTSGGTAGVVDSPVLPFMLD